MVPLKSLFFDGTTIFSPFLPQHGTHPWIRECVVSPQRVASEELDLHEGRASVVIKAGQLGYGGFLKWGGTLW